MDLLALSKNNGIIEKEIFLFIARSDKRSVAMSYVSAKRRSYGQKEPFSLFKDFLGAAFYWKLIPNQKDGMRREKGWQIGKNLNPGF